MKTTEFRKLIREEIRKVLKEAEETLDPNATYTIQIGTTRGEYDPYKVKKVSGNPLTVAKAIEKKAIQDLSGTDAPADEIVTLLKIDNDTYMVTTTEEDVTVVGSPKSKKYGAFWSDPMSDASEDLFNEMENDAQEISGQPQISKQNVKVGDIVFAKIKGVGTFRRKVAEIYPDKNAMITSLKKLKLSKSKYDTSIKMFNTYNRNYVSGPIARAEYVNGPDYDSYIELFDTAILVKK